ncbi:MAG: hypothetical protein HQL51_00380 [Magnetococcales bacterium]|nr:hypothetical protein [Magnetococcales bacterium]
MERDLPEEARFIIRGPYTPDNVPMDLLAQFMLQLAKLTGEKKHVHFVGLEEGSLMIKERIEPPAKLKVKERFALLDNCAKGLGNDPVYDETVALLEKHGTTGELCYGDSPQVIPFPGPQYLAARDVLTVTQEGSLDGVVVTLGNRSAAENKPTTVTLKDGPRIYSCTACRTVARDLAKHFDGPALRVYGQGTWKRLSDKGWVVDEFQIERFDVLVDQPLEEILREMGKHFQGWRALENPWEELRRIRYGDD